MKRSKTRHYIVVVRVTSRNGTRPVARVLGGDTIFVSMLEGQTANFVTKRVYPPRRIPRV